jgi:signal transduction histidine kinase
MNSAVEQYQKEATGNMGSIIFRVGAFVLLLILHLSFYLYYPAQKANLFFAMYALFVLIAESIATSQPNSVKYIYYHWNAVASFGEVSGFFLLTAIYYLVNRKRGWVYWALLLLTVIGVILTATVYGMGFLISGFLISTLVSLEIVRTAFIAIGKKQRGAWIIAAGAFSYFVFRILFLYLASSGNRLIPLANTFTLGDLVYNISFLSIPFAASIFLALDFASTSRRLQQKLVEVNQLSEKSLEQEKEKQQILASQKERLERQVTERTAQLKQSLDELKSAQAQLIQSEKMASLGELTAGIAHEIQNPLNFVNNFSEVSAELADEMEDAVLKSDREEIISIAANIKENLQKINHHGKRADAIVKGMLQHSRASTNQKELTDINKLTDEYLRLSYQGLRAKDQSFNATIQTDFDERIGKINIISQDIGRVLLNLFTNAFYSVTEKKKKFQQDPTGFKNLLGMSDYEPAVVVSTKKENDKVIIKVNDNGNGIPQKVLDKIFQPFFTTKPTGQGTGLGLSMSYDIIKAHGGEIKVETNDGEFAEFIIQLPWEANI